MFRKYIEPLHIILHIYKYALFFIIKMYALISTQLFLSCWIKIPPDKDLKVGKEAISSISQVKC